jgi:acetoacetyl-CoA synthetase
MTRYLRWVRDQGLADAADYDALWRWSTDELESFWTSIYQYFDVRASGSPNTVLARAAMPGAEWFPDIALNYAENIFARREHDDGPAVLHASEDQAVRELSWPTLRTAVAEAAEGLRSLGVGRGDRVAAYLPNVPEAIIAFLATASIGAIWASTSPDFGAASVIDRFAQIEPVVLIATDSYRYGGRAHDRAEALDALRDSLPGLRATVLVSGAPRPGTMAWTELLQLGRGAQLRFERVPFAHPLWTLYSSGTTGLPKALVHSHGGILLEHLKTHRLHLDLQAGDRFFWFTTTGWMMWNYLVSGLLTEAPIVLYDGNPGYPTLGRLWDVVAEAEVSVFGTSASFLAACMKAGIEPARDRDLSALTALGSTGSPLSPEGFDWVYEQLGDEVWLSSTSGGTDVCTAFLGGVPLLPVHRGELQARCLGVDLHAFDEVGAPVIGQVGELVVRRPMPSMPVRLWGDDDGTRYRESYFDLYPGVWRHGDWIEITSRGTVIVFGRSDSTINRSGIRMGTSEIYRAVLALPEIVDALVVDLPRPGTEGWMPLFVVLAEGAELDDELERCVLDTIRTRCSPRHVPDEVHVIAEVPRTITGKVLEVPVKRILMGTPPDRAASRDAMANPASLAPFVAMARAIA